MITELNAQVKVKARGNTTKVKVKSNKIYPYLPISYKQSIRSLY